MEEYRTYLQQQNKKFVWDSRLRDIFRQVFELIGNSIEMIQQ